LPTLLLVSQNDGVIFGQALIYPFIQPSCKGDLTMTNFKPIALIVLTVLAFGLGRLQYGTERPLDQANGVVIFLVGMSRLLEKNPNDSQK